VEQHAGEISVRSTPGEGTEFLVILPMQPIADARAPIAGREKAIA
jgi:signal transduction histidine kinase